MQVCIGGDEISFTNMGLVAEMVLAQVCVRLVSSFVGRLARGPTDQQMNSPSGHTLVPTPFQPLTPYL